MISYQVVQEFLNVATRKFRVPLKGSDARKYLDEVLAPLCESDPETELYRSALEVQEKTGFSLYDAVIVAGAERGG
jgi:predicted nucleic acid-binding protein